MPTKTETQAETFVLSLDPTIPLETQIQLGKYNYVHPDINARNFQLTLPPGKREIFLYDPRGFVSSETMIRRMKADGYVPAILDDALKLGYEFPGRQRLNPIVFFGPHGGNHLDAALLVEGKKDNPLVRPAVVLYAWKNQRERGLSLASFTGTWSDCFCFAAVRESQRLVLGTSVLLGS